MDSSTTFLEWCTTGRFHDGSSVAANGALSPRGAPPSMHVLWSAGLEDTDVVDTTRFTVTSTVRRTADIAAHAEEVVAAVIENRAGDVGVAACRLRSLHFTLSQYFDGSTHCKTLSHLLAMEATDILVPHTAVDSGITHMIQHEFDGRASLTTVHRRLFNEVRGSQLVSLLASNDSGGGGVDAGAVQNGSTLHHQQQRHQQHHHKRNQAPNEIVATDHYLCLAAFATVVAFVEAHHKCVLVPGTVRVRYAGLTKHVELDRSAFAQLHLVTLAPTGSRGVVSSATTMAPKAKPLNRGTAAAPAAEGTTVRGGPSSSADAAGRRPCHQSLVDAVDFTVTRMGARLLRSSILQPPRDLATIELRQDAVDYFLRFPAVYHSVGRCLGRIKCDVDHLVAAFSRQPHADIGGNVRGAEGLLGSIIALHGTLVTVLELAQSVLPVPAADTTAATAAVSGVVDSHGFDGGRVSSSSGTLLGVLPLDRRASFETPSLVVGSTAPRNNEHPAPLPTLLSRIAQVWHESRLGDLAEAISTVIDEAVVAAQGFGGLDASDSTQSSEPPPPQQRARPAPHALHPASSSTSSSALRRAQRCFAVRPRISAPLDLARRRYSDLIDQMFALCNELRDQRNIKSIRLHFEDKRGCCFTMDRAHWGGHGQSHLQEGVGVERRLAVPSSEDGERTVGTDQESRVEEWDAMANDFRAQHREQLSHGHRSFAESEAGRPTSTPTSVRPRGVAGMWSTESNRRDNNGGNPGGEGGGRTERSDVTATGQHRGPASSSFAFCDGARSGDPLFIQSSIVGRRVHATTRELANLNGAYQDVVAEILELERAVVGSLVDTIRANMSRLHAMSESIAILDLVRSLACFASRQDEVVRPIVSENAALVIRQGRNPTGVGIVLPGSGRGGGGRSTLNDVVLTPEGSHIVLTGPNGSGKSTYLRSIAHFVVLAHVGAFLPAKSATIRLCDRLMAHMVSDEKTNVGASSFTCEMQEISRLLRRVTSQSLLLIDELSRGTSHIEGTALAWSVSEFLADAKCFSVSATHLMQLTRLARLLPNVRNCNCEVAAPALGMMGRHGGGADAGAPRTRAGFPSRFSTLAGPAAVQLNFLFRVSPGHCSWSRYGLRLASRIGFPQEVLASAVAKLQLVDNRGGTETNEPDTTESSFMSQRVACRRPRFNRDVVATLVTDLLLCGSDPGDARRIIVRAAVERARKVRCGGLAD